MAAPAPRKVLVLEDDESMYEIIKGVLQIVDPKLEIDWFTTAEQVMESLMISDEPATMYSVVIADIFLEGDSTGVDVWRAMLKVNPHINFVVISNMPNEKFRDSFVPKGRAPLYLPKPFAPSMLLDLLKKMLK